MVSAFGSGKRAKNERWITRFPRLDRGALARLGALDPGQRTQWAVTAGTGAAHAVFVELHARVDGLEVVIGDRVQVVRYWYDGALPHGGLRQFLACPAGCGHARRTLYFDSNPHGAEGHLLACRSCLGLRYPTDSALSSRMLAAHTIADLRRALLKARPGSRRWKELLAQITALHATLTADVARVRRDLRRRLKNDYKRLDSQS